MRDFSSLFFSLPFFFLFSSPSLLSLLSTLHYTVGAILFFFFFLFFFFLAQVKTVLLLLHHPKQKPLQFFLSEIRATMITSAFAAAARLTTRCAPAVRTTATAVSLPAACMISRAMSTRVCATSSSVVSSSGVFRPVVATKSRVSSARCSTAPVTVASTVAAMNAYRSMSSAAGTPDIDASKMTIDLNPNRGKLPELESLVFGKTFTDHMFEVDWTEAEGWGAPRIVPFGNLPLHPAASSLHYALELFEGMKAYTDKDGNVRMFRPDMNMKRMNTTSERLCMPAFNGEELTKCLEKLLLLEKDWIPQKHGYSLYIRPTMISTQPFLGVAPTKSAKLFIIMSPVGPYYKTGFAPVKLYANPKNVRAWKGGTGHIKCGGNYAMSIHAQMDAAAKGYHQVMWLYGEDHQVTEVGTMNLFFFMKTPEGKKELVTAELDGTILPGVTRDSILSLAREWGEFDVSERHITMGEVTKAIDEGRMIEMFGSGTAAIVSPVNGFWYDGKDYDVPLDPTDANAKSGPLTARFANTIMDIQYGDVEHPWSVVCKE
jgi:branched-chain amino acid aminotransferase